MQGPVDLFPWLILAALGLAIFGFFAVMLWRRSKQLFAALIALRDRIDRSQRW